MSHTIPHTIKAKEKMRQAKLGKRMSPATEFHNNNIPGRVEALPRGANHWKWQEKPSYRAVHAWIAKIMGKPKHCSRCGFTSENSRQFHWANLSGDYLRDVTDWIRLCASCHYKMDKIHEKGWATRHAN